MFFNSMWKIEGLLTVIIIVAIGLVLWCAYRFLAKKRQNHKAQKNKDLARTLCDDDLKGLIDGIEDIDVIEDPLEVGLICVQSVRLLLLQLLGN